MFKLSLKFLDDNLIKPWQIAELMVNCYICSIK